MGQRELQLRFANLVGEPGLIGVADGETEVLLFEPAGTENTGNADSERTADGTSPPRPDRLQEPDRGLGPHQAYAFQWWMTMPLGLLLIWLGIRRELRDEDTGQPAKPKKVRIWDEEDY